MRKNHLMSAFAAFVLAAALLLSFVGCADKNGGDQTVTTPSAATDTADVTTSFDPFAHLGDNDSYRAPSSAFSTAVWRAGSRAILWSAMSWTVTR